jgi:FAD/FMN-containing dehydrogenase
VPERTLQDVSDVSDGDVLRLQTRLRGRLIRPSDDEYNSARRVWNALIDRRPGLIARCAGAADVMACVQFAREHRVLLAVRGGGHSVAGHGVCDGGLLIDLSAMRAVLVDPEARTARVQGGAVWGDVDHETAAFRLATTGGQISSTGVGGLTLGGGVGWLMREHGLTVDNLLSADVVLADGSLVTADAERHPDLFWGLRGGGGNFGVVTSFEFRLHPLERILGGVIVHPAEAAEEMLRFFREYVRDIPDQLTLMLLILSAPRQPFLPAKLHGQPIAAFGVCYSGPLEEGERVLRPLRAFGRPHVDLVRPMPYTMLQTMFDEGSRPGVLNYWKSPYLAELSDAVIERIVAHASRMTSPLSQVLLTHMEGAVKRVPLQATAFSHRAEPYYLEILSKWTEGEQAGHVAWAREFAQAMEPYATGGYVNFMVDDATTDLRRAYTQDAYRRLVALKNRYDPDNLFRVNHNVRPSS